MLCVSNVKTLIKYYELFKAKKEAGTLSVFIMGKQILCIL